jgi:hypothetical protein
MLGACVGNSPRSVRGHDESKFAKAIDAAMHHPSTRVIFLKLLLNSVNLQQSSFDIRSSPTVSTAFYFPPTNDPVSRRRSSTGSGRPGSFGRAGSMSYPGFGAGSTRNVDLTKSVIA